MSASCCCPQPRRDWLPFNIFVAGLHFVWKNTVEGLALMPCLFDCDRFVQRNNIDSLPAGKATRARHVLGEMLDKDIYPGRSCWGISVGFIFWPRKDWTVAKLAATGRLWPENEARRHTKIFHTVCLLPVLCGDGFMGFIHRTKSKILKNVKSKWF
jgi:hypothetical protein